MRAVQLVAYGDAVEGLKLRDVAEPEAPGPGEILVGTRFAPINVNDLMVVWGMYAWKPEPPETIGNEGMGVVLALGAGVTGLSVGDQVVLPFMSRTWRERLVVPADQVAKLPADADPVQAAMLAINAVTVAMLLNEYVDLMPGDAVVYNAATSGLGHWVAGLARRRGVRTVGLVRQHGDAERVLASGCDLVIADEDDLAGHKAALSGFNIRLALDGVGGSSAGRLAALLGHDGALVAYGAASHKPMEISAQHLIFKNLKMHGFFEGTPERLARLPGILGGIVDLIGPGGIRQPVAATYPPERIQEAVIHAQRGGKVLLTFK